MQKYGSRDYAALSPEMRKTFVKVVGYDQSALLSHIKNPTLLIWGDRDTETPLWMGQQMERKLPTAVWWCWKAARISHIWSRRRAFRQLCVSFC